MGSSQLISSLAPLRRTNSWLEDEANELSEEELLPRKRRRRLGIDGEEAER